MKISSKTWSQYMMDLKTISNTAATKFAMYIMRHDPKTEEEIEAAIEYAYALAMKYGEGASEMACQMYDAVAEASGKTIPPAVPAKTSSYGAIKRTVRRAMEKTQNPKVIGDSIGCEVKRVSLETIKQNAARDGAEFAWIPSGDSCSFCLALAANGWQKISKKTLKAGHKDHIHANCDCTYAVRFDENTEVEGYDPDALRAQWDAAEGNTSQEKIRFLDRKNYAANREAIRARKNSEYAARKGREIVANGGGRGIIGTTKISSPIESRKHPTGTPEGVAIAGDPLNARQKRLLEQLVHYDDRIEVDKRDVSMRDLAAMTAHENVEFAMFTCRGKRLLVRGERNSVNITEKEARSLAKQGYKWSGHTHPGADYYITSPSPGDRNILSVMRQVLGQKYSVIYSSTGRKYVFAVETADDLGRKK